MNSERAAGVSRVSPENFDLSPASKNRELSRWRHFALISPVLALAILAAACGGNENNSHENNSDITPTAVAEMKVRYAPDGAIFDESCHSYVNILRIKSDNKLINTEGEIIDNNLKEVIAQYNGRLIYNDPTHPTETHIIFDDPADSLEIESDLKNLVGGLLTAVDNVPALLPPERFQECLGFEIVEIEPN